ncbi:MAG: hypothetical protein R3Y64_02010 [Peptostreptococcaceae bacterium]
MFTNNRGSILLFSTIIFTVISVMTIMIVNINKSFDEVMNLEYSEFYLQEEALNSIELSISQIASIIDNKLLTINSEEEFNEYFTSQEFIDTINYKGDKITIDLSRVNKDDLEYDIFSKYQNNGAYKSFNSNIKINNPFITTGATVYARDLLEINSYNKN